MKIWYLDTETVGLNPIKNGIIQISGIIEINGEVKEEFDFKCRTFPQDLINEEALKVNGYTKEQIDSFEEPVAVYRKLVTILNKYVNRYDKKDKFYLLGQKIDFDNRFMEEWFKKCGDQYFYSYRHYGMVDLISLTTMMEVCGLYKGVNKKLETVAKEFGIDTSSLQLHNALNDIKVTREVFHKYCNIINPTVNSKQPEVVV